MIAKGEEIILAALVEGAPTLEVRDHFVDVQLKPAIADSLAAVAHVALKFLASAGAACGVALVAAAATLLS